MYITTKIRAINSLSNKISKQTAETNDNIVNKIAYIGLFIKIIINELIIRELEKKRKIKLLNIIF
jgi:hypothetical protein